MVVSTYKRIYRDDILYSLPISVSPEKYPYRFLNLNHCEENYYACPFDVKASQE